MNGKKYFKKERKKAEILELQFIVKAS